jgi:hypothetical protein
MNDLTKAEQIQQLKKCIADLDATRAVCTYFLTDIRGTPLSVKITALKKALQLLLEVETDAPFAENSEKAYPPPPPTKSLSAGLNSAIHAEIIDKVKDEIKLSGVKPAQNEELVAYDIHKTYSFYSAEDGNRLLELAGDGGVNEIWSLKIISTDGVLDLSVAELFQLATQLLEVATQIELEDEAK